MKARSLFPILLFLTSFVCTHAELAKGDSIPRFTVQDQHEKPFTLEPGPRYLLVSFDMSTGKAANGFLEKRSNEFLEENKALFLSNIHGMPWIGRKFALPKMRKYPHRILLADEEGMLDAYPVQDGKVTVLELDSNLEIVSVHFWDPRTGRSPFEG